MTAFLNKRSFPAVRRVRDIRDGKNEGLFFVEGGALLLDLFKSNFQVTDLFCTAKTKSRAEELKKSGHSPCALTVMTDDVMSFVSDLESAPGMLALVKRPVIETQFPESLDRSGLYLLIHKIGLPQNMGALLRSAEAAGVKEVWITETSVDPYSPKVVRGATGSLFRMHLRTGLHFSDVFSYCREKGLPTYAATSSGGKSYDEVNWTQGAMLAVGSEAHGFSESELELADQKIRIPMLGEIESLNAGVAASICLFEAARQRRQGKPK
jgi:RNA methyltransferase, TrmH family